VAQCAQEKEPQAGDIEVPSPPDKVVDPLQRDRRDVDPKLLVTSNGKGSTARRQFPIQTRKIVKLKVSVMKTLLVHVIGESMLSLCAHLHSVQRPSVSQPPPLEYEHAGGKRTQSASPPVATSKRPPRRQCSQPSAAKK
jgi:hypothetical protein